FSPTQPNTSVQEAQPARHRESAFRSELIQHSVYRSGGPHYPRRQPTLLERTGRCGARHHWQRGTDNLLRAGRISDRYRSLQEYEHWGALQVTVPWRNLQPVQLCSILPAGWERYGWLRLRPRKA